MKTIPAAIVRNKLPHSLRLAIFLREKNPAPTNRQPPIVRSEVNENLDARIVNRMIILSYCHLQWPKLYQVDSKCCLLAEMYVVNRTDDRRTMRERESMVHWRNGTSQLINHYRDDGALSRQIVLMTFGTSAIIAIASSSVHSVNHLPINALPTGLVSHLKSLRFRHLSAHNVDKSEAGETERNISIISSE